jgi:hypothetical protein
MNRATVAATPAPRRRRCGAALAIDDVQRIAELRALGWSLLRIGNDIGCAKKTVANWLKRLAAGQCEPRQVDRVALAVRARAWHCGRKDSLTRRNGSRRA